MGNPTPPPGAKGAPTSQDVPGVGAPVVDQSGEAAKPPPEIPATAQGLNEFESKADADYQMRLTSGVLGKNAAPTDDYLAQNMHLIIPGTLKPGKARTDAEAKAFEYSGRMEIGEVGLENSIKTGGVPNVLDFYAAAPSQTTLGMLAGNAIASDHAIAFMTSAQVFLNAILRRDSGAAVPESEYPQYWAQFIPLPGDPPQALARKKEARRVATASMKNNARMSPSEVLEMSKSTTAFRAADQARLNPGGATTAADPQLDALMTKYTTPEVSQ